MKMRNVSRSYTEIMQELRKCQNGFTIEDKKWVMCEAILWGYSSARTNFTIESRLYRGPSIEAIVTELTNAWDGQDFLGGALYIANRHYKKALS